MPDLKFNPVAHDHTKFLAKARQREGFTEACAALELEYLLASQMLEARGHAPASRRMPLPSAWAPRKVRFRGWSPAGKHAPSLATLKCYAQAVGCDLQVKPVPHKAA